MRHRFQLSIYDLGGKVPWDESVWLVEELLTDPAAHLTAAVLGWEHPVSREWVVLASMHDVALAVGSAGSKRKPPTFPRPWKPKGNRIGKTSLPPEEAKRVLAQMAGR